MTTVIISQRGRKAKKPSKPRRDYPLFAHGSGQWAKKVQGKLYYFGTWDDPRAAEAKWDRDREALLDGRNPDDSHHGDSLSWLLNVFLDEKAADHKRRLIVKTTLNDYHRIALHLVEFFGKSRRLGSITPHDFRRYKNSLPTSWAPTTINNHLRYVRAIFKYANDIESTPHALNYNRSLALVDKKTIRKHEAKQERKFFSAKECWQLLGVANTPMRAFILLGLNTAYGTADIGRLRIDQIDFDNQWLGEVRGKTGMARGAWLWTETIEAIQEAIDAKPWTGNEHLDSLAFLTKRRQPWFVDGSTNRPLQLAFGKLKAQAGIDRKGVGHYSLRHTFETIAGDLKDQPAVDYVMGHHDPSMAAVYREGIDPERIKAVCQHVREWWLAGIPKGGVK